MPETRQQLEREEKVAEIRAAAEARLREGGYEALSVVAIARELGLAPNSIYWYFPSKDHLFAAAVRQLLRDTVARKPPARQGLERRVLWFVDRLEELDHLRIALYERAPRSAVVAELVAELRSSALHLVGAALRESVPDAELELAAEALLATIEGTAVQGLDRRDRHRVVSFTLRRLTGG